MSRVRRKPAARLRLNFELAGIAALALAVLLGIALVLPASRAGIVGAQTAAGLRAFFGSAAGFFPLLVALLGGIVFLEINVPRLIAVLGSAAAAFFLIVDTAYGERGGFLGAHLWGGLRLLVGEIGADIVLVVIALSLTVWITNVSVKRVIGWLIARGGAVREMMRRPEAAATSGKASAGTAIERPKTLREAFALPDAPPKRKKNVFDVSEPVDAHAPAPLVPVPSYTVVNPIPAPPPTTFEPHAHAVVDDEAEDEDDGFVELETDPIDEIEAVAEAEDDENALTPSPVVSGVYEPLGVSPRTYRLPDLALFDPVQVQKADDSSRSVLLEDTLASFGVGAKVTHIERGPSITRYELKPERGVKISRISALADDLALALAATSVRIEAPIPGKSAVGIEIPNAVVSIVAIRELLEAMPQRGTVPPLNMALGKDITGRPVFGDLGKMPHLLVAGATGSGKSVCLNTIIASLLVSATPEQVQLLMIDPKRVELTVYNGIPHLIKEVITDARVAAGALYEMTKEMDSRYERFARAGVRKIEEYNAKFPDEKLPYVVIVIDELADLMLVAPAKVETTICRLAQLARATGMHLVVATQRPSVDVITGIIKANIPSRIAFAVSSQVDSRTILDMGGAERLLGRGDMLYLPIDAPKPVRSQGALITGAEVNRLVEHWAAQARPENALDVDEFTPLEDDEKNGKQADPLSYEAAKFIIETNYASTAQLQSRFQIGHPRAVRLMKQLEEFKVVGPHEGTKPRRILLGLTELELIASRMANGEESQTDLFAQGA